MQPTIIVEGNAELRKALRYIGDKGLVDTLKDAHREAAHIVVRRALPKVPVRTGRLRQSVRGLASQRDARVSAGRASVRYAGTVHFGRRTGNVGSPPGNRKGRNVVRGRPFLFDAIEETRPQVVAAFEKALDDLLDQLRGR